MLFRDLSGRAFALLDRCPHRNVPLSAGRVLESGILQCGYHGWQFDGGGVCRLVPGLCEKVPPRVRVTSYDVAERQGFVWVRAGSRETAEGQPFHLELLDNADYRTAVRQVDFKAGLHAVVENALDVPHTAYLHQGLFRGGAKHEITAVVRRFSDRVEVEYLGEPRPPGVAARILSPGGGIVRHWDRFVLPSIAQVEYRLGEENHLVITSMMTPVSESLTRLYAVVAFRLRLPGWLVAPLLEPLARRIAGQDSRILELQAESMRRFGGEDFHSTPIDLLGGQVKSLLRQAERGIEGAGAPSSERSVRLLV